jgi:hypothetical protein
MTALSRSARFDEARILTRLGGLSEEAALAADLAAEQNRWMDFNRLPEDLERAVARR